MALAASVGACAAEREQMADEEEAASRAMRHAGLLSTGDFHYEGHGTLPSILLYAEPYHIWRLIEIGRPAGQILVGMLEDERPTPFEYYFGKLEFGGGIVIHKTEPQYQKRYATIGDMADYALRKIYKQDVGCRSYLTKEERGAAIVRWKRVVEGGETSGCEASREQKPD